MASSSPSPIKVPRTRSKNRSKKAVNPSFADLPSCLLEIIMSRVVLKDNIRASAACKSWREAATYVRAVEKHPWLMCFPKHGGKKLFEFRDPLQSKSYTLKLPELPIGSTVCYSRDGWLLMRRYNSNSNEIFFFNPFSRELINLPKLEQIHFQEVAFSSAPTSDNCVLLALCTHWGPNATFRIWRPGATKWINITEDFASLETHGKLVYLNDRFYCFNLKGYCRLYTFHPPSGRWESHLTMRLNDHYNGQRQRYGPNKKKFYMAEKRGELFLIVTCGKEEPVVYKLVSFRWKEITSRAELDGLTFFVSLYNCELRSNLPGMRNNVYFSRFGHTRKHCAYYSFDESRYNWYNELHHRGLELCPPHSIWIDPPSNVLDYFVSESFA